MAFPGTYNINYYRGDTLEFRIYPKDSSGNAFDLTGYTTTNFTIATARGASATQYPGIVSVSSQGYILCVIPPEIGTSLSAGTSYVYDVEIIKPGTSYDYAYTVLTGTIAVTEHVSSAV